MNIYDTIIIGGGPAGLTAGLYLARERVTVKLIEKSALGGQAVLADKIENYPGFPDGISGFEFIQRLSTQAQKFGLEIGYDEIVELNKDTMKQNDREFTVFKVSSSQHTYIAKSIVLATGASLKKLGVPGEEEFISRGVSYCATCDAPFYRNKTVAVVGGGNSAVEETLFLTKFASKIYLIHRRNELRATKVLQDRIFQNEKIEVVWNTVVTEIKGDTQVNSVTISDVGTGEKRSFPVDGIFLFVGTNPQSAIVMKMVNLENTGYVKTDENMSTPQPGLFATGDVRVKSLRQVVTACNDGAVAAGSVSRYLTGFK